MIDFESRFYVGAWVERGISRYHTFAPFLCSLPNLGRVNEALVVLSNDQGSAHQGLYLWKTNRWFFILDQVTVSNAVKQNRKIDVYHSLTAAIEVEGDVYRNGQLVERDDVDGSANFVVVGPPSVATINGQYPDTDGNINISAETLGAVTSVNGIGPDSDGNVELTQFANYSISLPTAPEPGSTVYYQEMVDSLEYLSGYAMVKVAPDSDIQFYVAVNGTTVGTIDFAGGAVDGTVTITLTNPIAPGDLLEIVAPEDLYNAAVFSFVLTFARL